MHFGKCKKFLLQILLVIAAIAGLVLGLVNTFKKNVSPVLVLAYALLQGVFFPAGV